MVTLAPPADRLTPAQVAEQLARHEGMCWEIAHRFQRSNPLLDLEDLAAAARLGMLEGAARFEPSRGFTFATYCRWYALRAVRLLVKHDLGRGFKVPLSGEIVKPLVTSIDAPYRVQTSEYARPHTAAIGDSLAVAEPDEPPPLPADFWEQAAKPLDARSGQVLVWYHRDRLTFKEIAGRLDLSRARVQQIEARARKRLAAEKALKSLWEDLR